MNRVYLVWESFAGRTSDSLAAVFFSSGAANKECKLLARLHAGEQGTVEPTKGSRTGYSHYTVFEAPGLIRCWVHVEERGEGRIQ